MRTSHAIAQQGAYVFEGIEVCLPVIVNQLAVNRSTVREALRRLESAGLVGRDCGAKRLKVTRPGHADTASRVSRALTLDEVTFIELWEAMLAVAPRTAALAAAHASPESLAALEADIAAVETARGSEAAVAGVVDFFGRLALASGNGVLILAMQPVTRLLAPSLRRMIDRVPQGSSRIVVAQRCIVEALRKGDATESESWMTRHVQDFRRSEPKEIIAGTWGKGAGQLGLRSEGVYDVLPKIEAVTADKHIIISDTVNRKQLLFNSTNGKFLS